MIKCGYEIKDRESAEKTIKSFCNTLIFCATLSVLILFIFSFFMKQIPDIFFEPIITSIVFITLGLSLKLTKSRALSIIIFLLLVSCDISGLSIASGITKSGTIVAILLTISAFMSIKATFLRYKLLEGKTMLKNVIIINLLAFINTVGFMYLSAILIAVYQFAYKIKPNDLFISITFWICILLGYYLTFSGKLPFTNRFKIVRYPETEQP